MNQVLAIGGLLAAVSAVAYYWRRVAIRDRIQQRLQDATTEAQAIAAERRFARRFYWIPVVVGVATLPLFIFLWQWPINISVGVCIIVILIGLELEAWVYELRLTQIETQLADAIDVLVASLGAGSSLPASLAQSAEYSPNPLKREFTEMVARLRLGDDPEDVFELLSHRVPSDTFRLFATSLIVNWKVGGGLSDTLAGVGKTIRDRLTISRQIRTLSTQGRFTTAAVISVVWFMAAMMWQADPGRFIGFVSSDVGTWLITAALVMQGVGIALVSRISRPKI